MGEVLIIWDVDDVLNSFTETWLEWLKKKFQKWKNFCYKNLVENPPHKILGMEKSSYLNLIDEFRKEYYQNLIPREEILAWFREWGFGIPGKSKFLHFCLTAIPLEFTKNSSNWVFTHFGN